MSCERLLMTPGPTILPPRVLEALGREVIYNKTQEFEQMFDTLEENLQYVFQTKNLVMVFPSSGIGAMESTIANLFSAGEKVLILSTGAFGDRYTEIASQFGLTVDTMTFEWGEAIDVDAVSKKLYEDTSNSIKAVIMTHNECSTGITNDVKAISKLTNSTDKLLIVDAINCLGGLELKMDEWGVDAVITTSHKALMAPPGLSFISLSENAWKACDNATLPRLHYDYRQYKRALLKETVEIPASTPAISLMIAQAEALKMIKDEGLENVFARHKKLAIAAQEGILALGLELLPKREVSSHIITAVKIPENIDIEKAKKLLNTQYDIMVTYSHQKVGKQIFRIGHCGYLSKFDLINTFTALEYVLNKLGYEFETGASIKKIKEILK